MLLRVLHEYAGTPRLGMTVFRALSTYRRVQESLRTEAVEGDLATSHLAISSERSGLPPHQIEALVARWMEVEPLPFLRGLVLPALPELLSAARERGIRIAAVSDYPATAKLEAMGLAGFFDVVVAAQDAGINRFKPHPVGLAEALRRLGVDRSAALYVGDRDDVDGEAARTAGMRFVIVNSSCSNAATCGGTHVSGYVELHAMLFPVRNGQHS
jgi:FMN phosphatase YigB (HAD superfamily)